MSFLKESIEFLVDSSPPGGPPVFESRSIESGEFHVYLDHPEWANAAGNTVKIFYTLDGSAPGSNSLPYNRTNGIVVPMSGWYKTIRAISYDLAGNASSEMAPTEQVWIDGSAPSAPSIDAGSGRYVGDLSVTLDHDEWSTPQGSPVHLYYTFGPSPPDPTSASDEYLGSPIVFPTSDTTVLLKVIAIDEDSNSSAVSGPNTYSFMGIASAEDFLNPGDDFGPIDSLVSISVHGYGFDGVIPADVVFTDVDGTVIIPFSGPTVVSPTLITLTANTARDNGVDSGVGTITITNHNPNTVFDTVNFTLQ